MLLVGVYASGAYEGDFERYPPATSMQFSAHFIVYNICATVNAENK